MATVSLVGKTAQCSIGLVLVGESDITNTSLSLTFQTETPSTNPNDLPGTMNLTGTWSTLQFAAQGNFVGRLSPPNSGDWWQLSLTDTPFNEHVIFDAKVSPPDPLGEVFIAGIMFCEPFDPNSGPATAVIYGIAQ
jgi:hypothetical protein